MAADWIKMRSNLWDDPRVAALVDATDTSEALIVGGLYWLWAMADQHTEDGYLPGLSLRQIDRKTGITGFGAALEVIGWIGVSADGGIFINHFAEHNGASAKKRAQTARRVASCKLGNAQNSQDGQSGNADSVTESTHQRYLEKEKEKEEEHTEAIASDAGASPDEAVADPIWGTGLTWLRRKGIPEKPARSLLGKLRQACGDVETGALLAQAQAEDVSDPPSWLMAAASKRRSRAGPQSSPAAMGKTAQALMALEDFANGGTTGLVEARDRAGPATAHVLGPGAHAGGGGGAAHGGGVGRIDYEGARVGSRGR